MLHMMRPEHREAKYFVVGMPQSGTTSIYNYFRCGGMQNVVHQMCGRMSCARCMWENIQQRRPVFQGCEHDVYTQLDDDGYGNRSFCFFPQRNLSLLHASYPSSTFILNTRNPIDWVNSVSNWGDLRSRLSRCHLGKYKFTRDEDMIDFYNTHTDYVRQFARAHNHTLIEIDIEKNVSALSEYTSIRPTCFKDYNSAQHRAHHRTCFVGDSLLRYLWCWHETKGIDTCPRQHADLKGNTSKFFWKPMLSHISNGTYNGCTIIVWDNLFHEVRANPQTFVQEGTRVGALRHVHDYLSSIAQRVIFYVAQRPTASFALEAHANVTMLDAWEVDRSLADRNLSKWFMVRADTQVDGKQVDGRHYDSKGVGKLYARLEPLLRSR